MVPSMGSLRWLVPVLLVHLTFDGSLCADAAADEFYNPLVQKCSHLTFSSGSLYENNLDKLVHRLGSEAATNGGFLNYSIGDQPNEVFGVIMCNVDTKKDDCQRCLDRAPSNAMSTACPNSRTASIIYSDCVLRYSDEPFFSVETDRGGVQAMHVAAYLPEDVVAVRRDLMKQLVAEAAASPLRFANGSQTYKDSNKVYAVVQCRRDLTPHECTNCLTYLVEEKLLRYYPNNTAAYVRGFSCFARYHPEPFALT